TGERGRMASPPRRGIRWPLYTARGAMFVVWRSALRRGARGIGSKCIRLEIRRRQEDGASDRVEDAVIDPPALLGARGRRPAERAGVPRLRCSAVRAAVLA